MQTMGARSGCKANRHRKDETVSVTHERGREEEQGRDRGMEGWEG